MEKDDDDEETNTDDNAKFKMPSHIHQLTMDKILHNIKIIVGLVGFKQINFENLNNEEKERVEEEMLEMLCTFKMTPLQIGNLISKELYNIIDQKW